MLELAFPWALLLVLLLPLFWRQRGTEIKSAALVTPLFNEWKSLYRSSRKSSAGFKLLQSTIWVLLCLAAAKPLWIGEPVELAKSGRDLLLSIDISGSMEEQDLTLGNQAVDRLTVVKSVVRDFIHRREGDRIGLVLFGERAYLQTPLTFDLKTVQYMLDETEIGLAGATRTAIGDGIGLAVKHLQKRPQQNRVIILLTDGRNNAGEIDPIEAAKLAQHAGVKIYTIGVGADEMLLRSPLFGLTRRNPSAELDEKTLKQVAKLTGGRYFRARNTRELAEIYAELDKLEPVEDEKQVYRPTDDLYYIPLLLALFLMTLPIVKTLYGHLRVHLNRAQVRGGLNELQ